MRRMRATTIAAVVLGTVSVGAAPASAAEGTTSPRAVGSATPVPVIVEGGGAGLDARIRALGGSVDARLAIIDGVRATVPASAVAALRRVAGVRSVVADVSLSPLEDEWGDDTTHEGPDSATLNAGTWAAKDDLGSLWSTEKAIGAQQVYGKSDPNNALRKLTGAGVGVALIDTGVTPVAGLDAAGKVVNGPDLSFDSQSEGTRYLDAYSHGTHMASIIAGRDAGSKGRESDPAYTVGVAPDAKIVNVRAGAFDGSVDVSQVIAGIDWVVTNRAAQNIRVINLSYGTGSVQGYQLDPLAHAVESAWRAGIVVVVAAGNDGDAAGEQALTMPAIDPYVIAVGSSDHQGTFNQDNDTVGSWTNEGGTSRRADLMAPGKSIVGLRVPGSEADLEHPEGRVAGDTAGRYFRGTGTSQSTAVVSGAVALMLQRNPKLTPDQVKSVLKLASTRLLNDPSPAQGSGELNVARAIEVLEKYAPTNAVFTTKQTFSGSTGLGSLEAARGGAHVADPDTGVELTGEQDVFGAEWNAPLWASGASAATNWSLGTWRGEIWAGDSYVGSSWSGVVWSRGSWTRGSWTRGSWTRGSWTRGSWTGSDWMRGSWTRGSWTGEDWTRGSWTRGSWTRGSWTSGTF